MRILFTSLIAGLLFWGTPVNSQTVNKCTDSSGNVTFSDAPCEAADKQTTIRYDAYAEPSDTANRTRNPTSQQRQDAASAPLTRPRGRGASDNRGLVDQRQLAEAMLVEANNVATKASNYREASRRAPFVDQANILRHSANILMNAPAVSKQGVAMLEEANAIARRIGNYRDSRRRSSARSEARALQASASVLLNSGSAFR